MNTILRGNMFDTSEIIASKKKNSINVLFGLFQKPYRA